jgi:hypothetical protein
MKYFGHIKRHEGFEKRIMKGYIPGRRKRGRPKRRRVRDITDDLQISDSDRGHLGYGQAVFRWFVKGAKFRQGHATE